MSNYPLMSQSELEKAPFNQKELDPVEIEVSISTTLSKTVKVKVDDYAVNVEYDDTGKLVTNYDFSKCDLQSAVKEQINFPDNTLRDWCIDDFEVVLD